MHGTTFSATTTSCNDLSFFTILAQGRCPAHSPNFGAHGALDLPLRPGSTNVAEVSNVFVDQQEGNDCSIALALDPPRITVSCSNGSNSCTAQFIAP